MKTKIDLLVKDMKITVNRLLIDMDKCEEADEEMQLNLMELDGYIDQLREEIYGYSDED